MIKKTQKSESGQSFVEFSFSFVLLMVLLAGIVDFGRAFFSYISIYDGAREGAIFASNFSGDASAITRHVRNTSTDPINLLEEDEVTIEIIHTDFNAETIFPCAGDSIKVVVRYAFEFTMPFVSMFVTDNSLPLYATATSTVLYPACNLAS